MRGTGQDKDDYPSHFVQERARSMHWWKVHCIMIGQGVDDLGFFWETMRIGTGNEHEVT